MKINYWNLCLLGVLMVSLSACNGKEKEEEELKEFDRSAMLVNFEQNIITPRYSDYQSKVQAMKSTFEDFKLAPDANRLSSFKQSFEAAYKSWQKVTIFEFGPAMNVALRAFTNTYPVDTSQVKNNISNGGYNLGTASNTNAGGFPALDFLFFQFDEVTTLNAFTVDVNATEKMQYAEDILVKMVSDINSVVNEWSSSYAETFKSATGNDVGSSTGLLVNEMNKDFEIIKWAEVGIPLGKQTLDVTRPTFVQGYYSGLSNQLFDIHLNAIKDLYTGKHENSNTDGIGFDDYANALELKASNGNMLDANIKGQFEQINTLFQAVDNVFSVAVDQENSKMNDLHSEISKSVVYLKTDLPSGIGVQITYQDNDGD